MANTQTIIVQGDQYAIPVVIKQGNTVFTDQNVSGVKIAIGNAVYSYPSGGLVYENDAWQFPLNQKVSNGFPVGEVDFQAKVKMGDRIIGTITSKVEIKRSIIKGEW